MDKQEVVLVELLSLTFLVWAKGTLKRPSFTSHVATSDKIQVTPYYDEYGVTKHAREERRSLCLTDFIL